VINIRFNATLICCCVACLAPSLGAPSLALSSPRTGLSSVLPSDDAGGVAGDQGAGAKRTVMAASGVSRVIDFRTDQGTLMSVDASPDGRWIVFDLLGHIYRMPAAGGAAECLTQGSGVALNMHPRFSPNGREIAFVSDRSGQANVWIMAADGANPHPVYLDVEHRYATPVWTADGQSIIATRFAPTPGRAWHRRSAAVWSLPLHGIPKPLLQSITAQYYASSISRDGQRLFFYTSTMAQDGASIYEIGFKLQTLDLTTREIRDAVSRPAPGAAAHPAGVNQTAGHAAPQLAYDSGGSLGAAAEISPMISPDGKRLAFARALDEPRTNQYRHRTALFVRDLNSGTEKQVLDPITKDFTNTHAHYSEFMLPNFTWMPDGNALLISVGGKIVRARVSGDSGAEIIPFVAQVHRVISEQARRRTGFDPDNAVPVRYIQWPAASPNGRQLVFVALGRLWQMDLPDGKPRELTPDPKGDVQMTPAWSPDGKRIAFTTWNSENRGQVWELDVATGTLNQISTTPGEYIWPTWRPDGATVVAVRGPEPKDLRNAWNAPSGWQAVRFASGQPVELTEVGTPWQPLSILNDGRLYFAARAEVNERRVRIPYPDSAALELGAWRVMSVSESGQDASTHAAFPAAPAEGVTPVISPDGRWIAYQADYQLFVEKFDTASHGVSLPWIDPSPNGTRQRTRLDVAGGAYLRWHDEHTIEYAAGDSYVTYDVASGARHAFHVPLSFVRDNAPGTLALTNARIITMDGDRVLEHAALLVHDGRIACVGACSIGHADRIVDLKGKTIIPGLIDVHDHISNEPNGVMTLRRPASLLDLSYGVTTIVDPATTSRTLFPIAETTDAGRMLGPRTLGAADGVFSSVGGLDGTPSSTFGPLLELNSFADADYQVARRAAWGAVSIKNYRQSRREQQQWLVEAARQHGLAVTAEGASVLTDIGMIMDGQTGWEHYLPALPIYKDVSEFFGRAHANYSPTLSVAGFPDGAMFYYRPRANLPNDPKYTRFASTALLQSVAPRDLTPPPIEDFAFPILAQGAADIIRAGGTATVGEHGENPGIGTHWEMWTYAFALPPLQVLRMATISGARLVGIERDVGSITVGKLADLVVLNGNPLERIENTADIAYVMKGGRLYDTQTLSELSAAAAAARHH
jgi:Tol biopolymer transport system component